MATVLATQNIVGNVGQVHDLRTVGKNNTPVIDFSVAVTPRKKDGDEWVDGETYWVNCTAWNRLAENVKASFTPGDPVIVLGRTDMKDGYTNKDGEQVPARPIVVAEFAGIDITRFPAESKRKSGGNGGSSNAPRNGPAAKKAAPAKKAPVEDDLFADDDDFDFDSDDEPPF